MRLGVAILGCMIFMLACTTPTAMKKTSLCEGKVQVVAKQPASRLHTEMWVRNSCYVPMTVALHIEAIRNIAADRPLPAVETLAAGDERQFVTLKVGDTTQAWSYESRYTAKIGGAPQPDSSVRYRFPFGGDQPRRLSQGVAGGETHKGPGRYSFDFEMPIGTPILAARAGVVLAVIDGHPAGGRNVSKTQGNSVLVYHEDGTIAMYGHLRRGISVAVGDFVAIGSQLGLSGNSGFSTGPHLHFSVGHLFGDGGVFTSLPIRFEGDRVPESGRRYEPQTTTLLP